MQLFLHISPCCNNMVLATSKFIYCFVGTSLCVCMEWRKSVTMQASKLCLQIAIYTVLAMSKFIHCFVGTCALNTIHC